MQGDGGQPESGHLPVSVACPRIELADAPRRNPRIQRMAKGASEESSDTGNDDAPEVASKSSMAALRMNGTFSMASKPRPTAMPIAAAW